MAPTLAQLTKDIAQKATKLNVDDEEARQDLLRSAGELVQALETPAERISRMTYLHTITFAMTSTLIDAKVFRLLSEVDAPQKVSQLAAASGMDPGLLERMLKHVATQGYVGETGPDEYVANETTRFLASPGAEGMVKDMFSILKIGDYLPSFFKETQYANPKDKDNSPWCRMTGKHYFDYIFAPGREEMAEAFHNHMSTKSLGRKWYQVPAIMEAVFGNDKSPSDDVLLVDVGGDTGYDLLGFREAHRALGGRAILQDLPTTIQTLDTKALAAKGVEAMAHDMFTPQPIQGAKAYYLKMVLHDWPAEQCRQVLTSLKAAMKPGYSRILLNEIVIPDVRAGWYETSLDLLMMMVHGAQERREREWMALVESVEGLRVRMIWNVEGAVEKVVEVEVV